jgi:dephospho-CoA kinase
VNIGLTGGMGCGKSTALRYFADAGAAVFESDAWVRQLLAGDPAVIAAVIARFGAEVCAANGMIDRAQLAARVFDDPEELRALEAILHPRVRSAWERFLGGAHGHAVVEIPLLFEKDLQHHFDLTVCIAASPAVQLQRLLTRGLTSTHIAQRTRHQFSLESKSNLADITLWNDGDVTHLRDQITWLVSRLHLYHSVHAHEHRTNRSAPERSSDAGHRGRQAPP